MTLDSNFVSNGQNVKALYDEQLASGEALRQLVFPRVFEAGQFIGQYSDNTADDIRYLAKKARIDANAHVLDVGCGAAAPACLLAAELGCRVTGIDVSEHHLAAARARIRARQLEERVRLVEGDIYTLAGKLDPADVAVGLGAWCHLDPRAFFRLCRSLLVPGGRIAFMERVKLGPLDDALLASLTSGWACPSVESFESYYSALHEAGFEKIFIHDLTPSYLVLQRRCVSARLELKEEIVRLSNETEYADDLALVRAECDAASKGQLGYALFVAERI